MKIAKLLTWHWGSLEDREWVFADTVLLTGESGSGKSTLLDAIQTVLTAAHHHLVQFNIGQDESTQSRRGGKEPRTLAAYALGQQADGVFLRSRCTSYAAIVFEASEGIGEQVAPFTALVGLEAFEDGKRAVLVRQPLFYIVRRAITLDLLARRDGEVLARSPLALKELYLQLQHRLKAGPETVQRFEDKSGYLQHLYGALMGKIAVSDAEASRAAKSIVKAMAYKELGNVNDLVRDEILEAHDFSHDLDKMRELMRSMAALKAEAERLLLNLQRLGAAEECAQRVLEQSRRFVVTTIGHALRVRDDAEAELQVKRREIAAQHKRLAHMHEQLASFEAQEEQLRDQLRGVEARLSDSDVARQKAALDNEVRQQADQFRLHWHAMQRAMQSIAGMVTQLEQLLALDLTANTMLKNAVDALRQTASALLKNWPAMTAAFMQDARLDTELPAFELEAFDADLALIEYGIRGSDHSVHEAVLQALAELGKRIGQCEDEHLERDAELRTLQTGRPTGPPDARAAIELIERELPQARPHLLSQLIEPLVDTEWQHAIEGYMGGDRFALIVDVGLEARCARLVKQRFPVRSPKVVQGAKAIEDTEARQLDPRAILHELKCTHPVAKAFLMAQYGRVRKVDSEEALARTPQGLMKQGLGSRGYGMFSCQLPDAELTFGEAARQRRRLHCEVELVRLTSEICELKELRKSLNAIGLMFAGTTLMPLTPLLLAVLESKFQYTNAAKALSVLDLSSIEELLDESSRLKEQINKVKTQSNAQREQVGATNSRLTEFVQRETTLHDSLPALQTACINASVWASRFVAAGPEIATESQLIAEATDLASNIDISQDAMRQRIVTLRENMPSLLRELALAVGSYLSGARDDAERFVWTDPPKDFDRMEAMLAIVLSIRGAVIDQIRRQRAIGLAENADRLREAESQFNQVFTTSFCFKVRDDVKKGAATLQGLNRHLKGIRFGADTFELQWDWIPRMQKVYEFFEAVEDVVESLERERGSMFESPLLTDEHRATAEEIRLLLLANDQGASERALKELADYRNYRRYDILRTSPVGQTRLSTWGTGSGGELETPFYVVRSAVLAHALGHFGRDRREAPALRLMLSDEAFSKMDESRSRSVLQFLSRTLGLQLVVAMPTSKSGAVKPEFDKEFTFSKVLARRDGHELFVSEVQEKTLHRQALARLWADHASRAREAARAIHIAANPAGLPANEANMQDGPVGANDD